VREVLDRLERAHLDIIEGQQIMQARGLTTFTQGLYLMLNDSVHTLEYVLERIREKEKKPSEKP